ncbi:MAG: hypothetical protein L0I24_20260, partial [Pseudonocardia sp.]|nr:hypothetical protein [Pseudonocardia sp.]
MISGHGGLPDPARVTIRRRAEWAQTDAAGHHHWTAMPHWAEQAETVLHERLGIAERTFGREPRVDVPVDFTARLYFRHVDPGTGAGPSARNESAAGYVLRGRRRAVARTGRGRGETQGRDDRR